LALHFIVTSPLNPSASSLLYPSAVVGCWWDLRRDFLLDYLRIILQVSLVYSRVCVVLGLSVFHHGFAFSEGQAIFAVLWVASIRDSWIVIAAYSACD
jgi:hypothetical protein